MNKHLRITSLRLFLLSIGYYACEAIANRRTKKNYTFFHKLYFYGLKLLCITLLTYYLKITYALVKQPVIPLSQDEGGCVVSLTTFPARIKGVWMVLDSIFRQTVRPSKILLVLTKEEFPSGMDAVPNSLKRMIDKGLEIVFVDYNLRPHNKYYHALSTFKDRDVVTLDDDLYYWPDTIERLYELKKKYPHCICANRALRISMQNETVTYLKPLVNDNKGHFLMAQGVGGVLYPPIFRTDELFNKRIIKELSLSNDDNWLKVQEILAGIPVAAGQSYPHPLVLLLSQRQALFHKNTINGRSARITQKLMEHYGLTNLNLEK